MFARGRLVTVDLLDSGTGGGGAFLASGIVGNPKLAPEPGSRYDLSSPATSWLTRCGSDAEE